MTRQDIGYHTTGTRKGMELSKRARTTRCTQHNRHGKELAKRERVQVRASVGIRCREMWGVREGSNALGLLERGGGVQKGGKGITCFRALRREIAERVRISGASDDSSIVGG